MSLSPVCRTCLVIISGDKTGHNIDDEKASQSAREMISFCVPEMDTYVSKSPSICDNCFDILMNFYNFKVRCLQVENAIRSYFAANNMMESSSVDLRNVARVQALEAMKQNNWSHSAGRNFIATMDKCLDSNKTTQQQNVLAKCGKSAAASTALPTARQSPINDSSRKDVRFIKVRKDLMPGKQKANSALTVNPVNLFGSKVTDKQRNISRKSYDALQLCPVTGILKKPPGKRPRTVSESHDVIINPNHQSDDDEVILINDNEQDSAPAKSPVKASTVKTYSSKRKLQGPVAVDETEAKRPKVQTSSDPSLSISAKKNERQLMVRLRKDRMLKCAFCSYVGLKINSLLAHYFRCHKVCKLCNFRCVRTYALNKHISQKHLAQLREVTEFYEVTQITDFICGLCKFSGNVALDLVEHRLEKHIKKDQNHLYSCPFLYCEFRHAVAMDVAEHIDQTHDRPDRKECLMCNFVASSAVKVKRHAEFHDQTFSTCTICGYKCKTSLKKHMEKNHQIANWVQDDTVVGMVADDVLMYYDKLTSSDDFKITLASSGPAKYTVPSASTVAPGDDDDTYSWNQPSLSEMLSNHVLAQVPEQQETVDDMVAGKVPKISKTSKKKGKQLKKKTNVLNDSDDCVLVGDVGRAVVTIDLSDENELPNEAETPRSEKSSEELIVEDALALSRGSNEDEAVVGSGNADNSQPDPGQSSETSSEKNLGQDIAKDNEVSESVDKDDTGLNSPVRNEDKEVEANCHQDSLDVVKEVDDPPAEPSLLSNNESLEINGNSKNAPLGDLCAEGKAPKSAVENCSDKQNSNELVQGDCNE